MNTCAFLPPLNRRWRNLPIAMIDSVRSCLEISPGVPDCAAFYESIMQYLRKNEEWELEVPVDDPVVGVWDSVNVYIRHIRETTREKGVGRKTLAWSEFGCTAYYSSRVSAPLNLRPDRIIMARALGADFDEWRAVADGVVEVRRGLRQGFCSCAPPSSETICCAHGARFCNGCALRQIFARE